MTEIVLSSLFLLGAGMAVLGWWPSMRALFQDNPALGCAAWLAPFCALVYAIIHKDDLERELWLQLGGVTLMLASAGLRYVVS